MDSGLIAFVARADQDSELQALLAAAATPQAILDLAAGRGFAVEWDALRQASRELSDPTGPGRLRAPAGGGNFLRGSEPALRLGRRLRASR